MILAYQIGGFPIIIDTSYPEQVATMLPSFAPFQMETVTKESPLLKVMLGVSVDKNAGQEIHAFEWEGSICTIRQLGSDYIVTLCDKRTGCERMMHAYAGWHQIEINVTEQEAVCGFFLNYFIMMSFSFAAASYDTLMMHASVIEYQEKGILFLGKSGTGKSTHARLWQQFIADTMLLNDDNPIVRLLPDGRVWVYGSPWSGKTPCYRNRSLPVSAFVRLRQSPINQLHTVASALQSFTTLFPSCSNMAWDPAIHASVCATLGKIIPLTRIAVLDCLPDEEAVRLSQRLI